MAVTVVKRPQGHKISAQALEAAITDSGGDALITALYHGLGTGDFVYIDSDIDEYNGFWYVTIIDTDQFKISEYATADFVEYFQDLDIEYYQTDEHDWNSVFLPIVYKCSNNRWPINTVDSERTISSFTDDNGYTAVVVSANLKITSAALEFVIISGSSDEDLNGVWQLVEVVGSLNYTLDLPYDASNDLVGASIQYYYNNYQVRVKIYGGLPATHPWQAKKPYVEVGELSLTPDENGIVMFSVADYIKSKVAIKNNTTIFSYPLNLDAFTGFYIATSETYDRSDGYTLITDDSAEFEDDTFEGYAIAGKLPFKNIYSGDYADYVYTDSNPALWLTVLDRLVAIENKYFDISFIKNIIGTFSLVINKYVSDYLTATETIAFIDNGIGVYRIQIEVDSIYDSYCVYISSESEATILNNADFANNPGADEDWATGASPSVTIAGSDDSDLLWIAYPFVAGQAYSVTLNYNASAVTIGHTINVFITNNTFVTQFSNGIDVIGTSGNVDTTPVVFVATASTTRIAIKVSGGGFGSTTITVNQVGLTGAIVVDEQVLLNSSFDDSSAWTQSGSGPAWAVGGASADISIATADSQILLQTFTATVAGDYEFNFQRISSNFAIGPDSASLGVTFYDEDNNLIGSASYVEFISGNNNVIFNHPFTTTVPVRKVQIVLVWGSGADMDVSLLHATLIAPTSDATVGATLTQEICIDIIESCEAQGGIVPTDIRLLEDGSYRLLE